MNKDEYTKRLLEMLNKIVLKHKADSMLLSGGLDTSALALMASRAYKIEAITVAFKDRPGPDVKYSQMVAEFLKIKRYMRTFDLNEALHAINEVISILRTFDPAEIRNGVTIFFGLKHARKLGFNSVMTGDGGDELFAGYDYMLNMGPNELDKYIRNLKEKWTFSAADLGKEIGIRVVQPYLDEEFVEYALSVPPQLKVREKNGIKYGKWIVRVSLQGMLPDTVIWRRKAPIEIGSGSTRLNNILGEYVSDVEFKKLSKLVKLRDKEHAYYFSIYRELIGKIPKPENGEKKCSYCGAGVSIDRNHCRICGGSCLKPTRRHSQWRKGRGLNEEKEWEMKIALFSGKDSLYASMKFWPLDMLLHLIYEFPRPSPHSMNLTGIVQVAGALGLPLVMIKLDKGRELDQTACFLRKIGAKAIIAGDIYVKEHLKYIERVAKESCVDLMEPLWGTKTDELLRMEIHEGIRPIIIGVNERINEGWLGSILNEENLDQFIDQMRMSGLDPLGENGEYHTIVLDSPVHRYDLHFNISETVEFSGYKIGTTPIKIFEVKIKEML